MINHAHARDEPCWAATRGCKASVKDSASVQKRTEQHGEPHPRKMGPPSNQIGWPPLPAPHFSDRPKHPVICYKYSGGLLRFPHRSWQSRHLRTRRLASEVAFTRVHPFVAKNCTAEPLTNRSSPTRQRPQRLSRQCLQQYGQDQEDGSQRVHAWFGIRRRIRLFKVTPKMRNEYWWKSLLAPLRG